MFMAGRHAEALTEMKPGTSTPLPPAVIKRHRFDVGIEELQTFLAVAELGSFSRAAEHLSLSQPSISNRVKRLEGKLSVRLLDRTTRRAELTVAGQLLYREATETLLGLRKLLQDFNKEALSRDRQVKVAATPTFATISLPPILALFHKAHPSITILLQDLSPADALDHVADGRCDLAVVAMAEPRPNVSFEPLLSDTCAVITSRRHPLLRNASATLADVLKYPLLSSDRQTSLRNAIIAEARERDLAVTLSPEARGVSSAMALLAMAAAGLGVCFYPRSFVPAELEPTVGMVPLADCQIVRRFGIVTADHRPLSASARKFCDFLRTSIAQLKDRPRPDMATKVRSHRGSGPV